MVNNGRAPEFIFSPIIELFACRPFQKQIQLVVIKLRWFRIPFSNLENILKQSLQCLPTVRVFFYWLRFLSVISSSFGLKLPSQHNTITANKAEALSNDISRLDVLRILRRLSLTFDKNAVNDKPHLKQRFEIVHKHRSTLAVYCMKYRILSL